MRKSFIFVETDFGDSVSINRTYENRICNKMCELYGLYDIVVEIEAQTVQKLNEAIGKIKNIQIVRSTTTMIARSEE